MKNLNILLPGHKNMNYKYESILIREQHITGISEINYPDMGTSKLDSIFNRNLKRLYLSH